MKNRLKVLSIGAGAIGTYIGGSLALQGHRVVFAERPIVAEAVKSQGLRLSLGDQDHHIADPTVVGSIEEALQLEDFDVALFALKSYDTQVFLNSIVELRASFPPILCLSNGVANEPAIGKILGPDKVIAGTVTSAVGRRAAGDIVLEKLRGVGVAAGHPQSENLVTAMDEAGLNAQLFLSAADMKWSKMLTNLIANATSAILDMPPGEIFAHPELYQLEIAQLRETLKVMRAQRIKTVDLPGTPVRLLAFAVQRLPLSISRLLLGKAVGSGRGDKMPSFHIDLHSGRGKSEVGYLNGAVVQAGKHTGIPAPVNHLLSDILTKLTKGDIPLENYAKAPEKLLRMLKV